MLQDVGFGPVDGEIVLAAHFYDSTREPAPVHGRQPAGGVMVALFVAVESWSGQGQIERVGGKAPARG